MDVRRRLILLAAIGACGKSDPSPTPVVPPPPTIDAAPAPPPPPTGALLYEIHRGAQISLAMLDLATRKSTLLPLQGRAYAERGFDDDRRAVVTPEKGKPTVIERDAAGAWRTRPLAPRYVALVSPKGDRMANQCMPKRSDICIGAIAGGDKPLVVHSGFELPELNVWTPDDVLVVTNTDETGAVVKLVDATTGAIREVGKTPSFDALYIAPGGRVLAWIETSGGAVTLATAAREEPARAKKIELGAGHGAECDFAGDTRVVCSISMGDDPRRVVSIELATGAVVELAQDGFVTFPVTSPDGRWVVYLAGDQESTRLMITPVDVADPKPLVPDATETITAVVWLR